MNRVPSLRLFDFGRAIEKFQSLETGTINIELYNATINIIDFIDEFYLTNCEARIENSKSLKSLSTILMVNLLP